MTTDHFINEYLPLIKHIAKGFYQVPYEDLLQAGAVGLLKAYKNYRHNKTTKFSSYAYEYIFGEMYDLVNKNREIKVSKEILKLAKKIALVQNNLSLKLNRTPTYEEIAKFLDIDTYLVWDTICMTKSFIYLDNNNEESRDLYETIPSSEIISLDDKIMLLEGINTLPEEDKQIIKYRYFDDYTQTEVAKRMGITQVMVSRRETKSLAKIKKYYEVA